MDFTKFLALLETKSLHMAALTSFHDPFEGHPPKSVIDAFTALPPDLPPDEIRRRTEVVTDNLHTFQNTRKYVSASCWHMNQTESAGMWAQYLRSGEGIAVQTTFSKLKASVTASPIQVTGALVQYVDFDNFEPNDVNILVWAALKRTSFEHEREFRLLSLHPPSPAGFALQVDLPQLVENVFLAPTTPSWVFHLVHAVLARYQIPLEPRLSELQNTPSYYVLPSWAKGA